MADAAREAWQALGKVNYAPTSQEEKSRVFRRSLFVILDVKQGDPFTEENVRSIRPGYGLPPKLLPEVIGRRAAQDIPRGTPLDWSLIA